MKLIKNVHRRSAPARRPTGLWAALAATAAAAVALALAPAAAQATTYCGSVHGISVSARKVSCKTALSVYRTDAAGHRVKGWVCSAAIHQCSKGHLGAAESVFWGYGDGQGQ